RRPGTWGPSPSTTKASSACGRCQLQYPPPTNAHPRGLRAAPPKRRRIGPRDLFLSREGRRPSKDDCSQFVTLRRPASHMPFGRVTLTVSSVASSLPHTPSIREAQSSSDIVS